MNNYYHQVQIRIRLLKILIMVFFILVGCVVVYKIKDSVQSKDYVNTGSVAFGEHVAAAVKDAVPSYPTPTPLPTPTPRSNMLSSDFPYTKEGNEQWVRDIYSGGGVRTAYLTFDDGPSPNVTPQILDILKKYDVKATFFVLGKCVVAQPEILKRTYDEGHSIAIHGYSHEYKVIYSNSTAFIKDVTDAYDAVKEVLGKDFPKLFRFPGGSFDNALNPYKKVLTEQLNYRYIDWNCLNQDSIRLNVPKDELLGYIKSTSQGLTGAVVLMHDSSTKATTAESLAETIEYFRDSGFIFGQF